MGLGNRQGAANECPAPQPPHRARAWANPVGGRTPWCRHPQHKQPGRREFRL